MSKKSIEAVLARLRQIVDVKTDSQLARTLEINRQTLSSWKNRGHSALFDVRKPGSKKRVSLDWLLTGDYFSIPEEMMEGRHSATRLSSKEARLLEIFNSLDEKARLEIQCMMEERKRLQDMEQQLRELHTQLQAKKICSKVFPLRTLFS